MSEASLQKKGCYKCNKGGVFMCDGCYQSFCQKHTVEHREELAVQMNNISQEYDIFEQSLNKEIHGHPLLSRIDQWEQKSINKIQQVAKQARVELRELIDRNRKDLETSLKQTINELQSSRDYENYTEVDFENWTMKLKDFCDELEKPLIVNVIDDDDEESIIRLIKVSAINRSIDTTPNERTPERFEQINQEPLLSENGLLARCLDQDQLVETKPNEKTPERFEQIGQKSLLSEDGLLASCLEGRSAVYGIWQYSTNKHHIRFRIERSSTSTMFFGITTHEESQFEPSCRAPSTNGWWNLGNYVKDGKLTRENPTTRIKTGDEITLTLDCDQKQISFLHHPTQNNATIAVDLQKCPLPWKILVAFSSTKDCVRLLSSSDLSVFSE